MDSTDDDAIWRIIDKLLAYHQKPGRDLTPTDALNRLFARHVRRERLQGMPRLDRTTCSAALELWTSYELKRLVRWHARARPRFEAYPIVAARCGDRCFLLDGNNRTNKWLAEEPAERRGVIIVRPRIVVAAEQVASPTRWAGSWRPAFNWIFGRMSVPSALIVLACG